MKIKEEIAAQKDLFYEDLNKIIAIRSVKGSPKKEAPFGEGPKRALEETLISGNYWSFRCSTRRFWLVSAALSINEKKSTFVW